MEKVGLFRERAWNFGDAVIFAILSVIAKSIWSRVEGRLAEAVFILVMFLVGFVGSWLIRRYIAHRVKGLTGAELEQRKPDLDRKEAHLNELHDRMEVIVKERKEFFDLYEACYQQSNFGRELKKFPPLEEMALQVMSASVSELLPSLNEAVTEAGVVWNFMTAQANAQRSDNPAVYELYNRVHTREYQAAHVAADRLKAVLHRKQDPRAWLVLTYACYRDFRRWVIRLTDMTGGPVPQLNGYADWRTAEKAFSDELTRKLAIPGLVHVANEIRDEEMRQGGPLKNSVPTLMLAPSAPSSEEPLPPEPAS